ncbi:hypothetical protein C8Q72DRAFT_303832 [Fomitopsis betulina]|nr:hypothetical protein C8Q72DRAFT_303832 [Fomitopsis betulina]
MSLCAAAGSGARRVNPFDGRIAEEKRGQKMRFRREGRIWLRSLPRNGVRARTIRQGGESVCPLRALLDRGTPRHGCHRYYRTIVHRTLCRSDRKSSIIFTLSSLKASAFGGDRRFRADWMEAISRAGLQSAGSAGHKSHHRAETRSTIWRHGGLLYEQLPRLSISARCAGNTADSPPLILHFVCQPSEFRARWGPLRRARRACQPPALALPTGRGAPRGLRTSCHQEADWIRRERPEVSY